MLVVAALLTFGRTEAASGQTLGPSFDCASVREGLAAVICGSRELGPADLALVQAYQALRHQIGQPGLAPLRREAVEFSNGVAERCGIPKTGAVAASPGMVGCVKAAYEAQRASWQARLAGPAREEAGRPLEQHVQLQRALLGPGATADGVYGPGTRAAITAWQQSAGLAASGFLGDIDAKRLALSPPTSFPTATPAANSAPPSPGQAMARSTNQEVSILAIEGRRLSRNLAGDYVSSGPIKICTSGLDTYPDVNAAISVLSQILRQEKGLSALERTWWNIEGESPTSHECDAVAVTRPIRTGNSTYRGLPEILTITPVLFAAEQARRERLRAEAERARAEAEAAKAARVREIRDGRANGVGLIRVSGGSVVCVLQTHANAATHLRDKRDGRAADLRGATIVVAGSLDNAFIDLKTRRCGAFFGEAPDLRRLMDGLGRDNLQMSLLDTWLTMQELGNAEAEFHEERRRNEVAAAERQRQAEEAARGASEAAARSRCEADPACRLATARGPEGSPRATQVAAPANQPSQLQQGLAAIVNDAAMRYRNASNDMARGNERPTRAQAICRLMGSNNVTGFVGTIETLSSNNDGHGVLAVRLSRNMTISTWNNSFSDSSHKTLISNGSPLHRQLMQMRVGQKVSVDGAFFSDNDDCLDEKSVSVSGGMREPDFLFKFSNVQALD